MISSLAQKNIERFNVKPRCGNCDFWLPIGHTDEMGFIGECRINEFNTVLGMVCDEWELD